MDDYKMDGVPSTANDIPMHPVNPQTYTYAQDTQEHVSSVLFCFFWFWSPWEKIYFVSVLTVICMYNNIVFNIFTFSSNCGKTIKSIKYKIQLIIFTCFLLMFVLSIHLKLLTKALETAMLL